MGIITKIEEQKNRNRINVFVDGDFYCGLEKETAVLFRLKVGNEVSEDDLYKAIFSSEQKRAFEKAMSYIAIRLHSEKEISDKLKKRGFSDDVIENTIIKLKEYGYVNDIQFATTFIEQNKKYSKRIIFGKLISKGISNDIAESAINNIGDEEENDGCMSFAKKYINRNKVIVQNSWQKLSISLLRRGYDYDTIRNVLEVLKNENKEK